MWILKDRIGFIKKRKMGEEIIRIIFLRKLFYDSK